jgi:pimeloyl-ACP methyl ester carboxylesterase
VCPGSFFAKLNVKQPIFGEWLMTTIPIRDVSLFVKVMGQGYPLLLMHGGPALDHSTLLPLQTLADQFTLIFYDHMCNGRSEGIVAWLLKAASDNLEQPESIKYRIQAVRRKT